MQSALAYFLLYVSATFYCGFDEVLKEKTLRQSNNAKSSTVDRKCEMYECVAKTLKLYNDGKFIEDGWVTIVRAAGEYDAKTADDAKKEISKCLVQVNQQISSYPKCTGFKIGSALIEECVKQALPNRPALFNFVDF